MKFFVTWTDEQFEKLKELLKQPLSGSEIARELGITRNAVLGKVHRSGLQFAFKKVNGMKPKARPKIRRTTPFVTPARPLARKAYVEEPVPKDAPPSKRLKITDLDNAPGQCRFITAMDPEPEYCGHRTEKVYCPYHKKLTTGVAYKRADVTQKKGYRP